MIKQTFIDMTLVVSYFVEDQERVCKLYLAWSYHTKCSSMAGFHGSHVNMRDKCCVPPNV